MRCLVTKPLDQFYKQSERVDGHRGTCKNCQYTPRPRVFASPQESAYRKLFLSCLNSAKTRNLPFELTQAQHKELTGQYCHHCGAPPVRYNPYQVDKNRAAVSPERFNGAWILKSGIDRLDNDVGYTLENCVAACQACNYGRQDYSVKEYVEHCQRVVEFQCKK
jgi:hypothetical protein